MEGAPVLQGDFSEREIHKKIATLINLRGLYTGAPKSDVLNQAFFQCRREVGRYHAREKGPRVQTTRWREDYVV